MGSLLEYKQKCLAAPGALATHLESVRPGLLDFYHRYPIDKQNSTVVIGHMKVIIERCNLPIPKILISLLESLEKAQHPEQTYDKLQRDHLLHSLNLFCLGALLINEFPRIAESLEPCSRDELVRKWAFCSLLHDIGYIETLKVQTADGSDIRDDLREKLVESFRTINFQLVCALGYCSPINIDIEACGQNQSASLSAIAGPAQRLIAGEFGPSVSTIGKPGIAMGPKVDLRRYFSVENLDHGIASSVLLSLCKNIARSITCCHSNFTDENLPPPKVDLWSGLEEPLFAIAFHHKRSVTIDKSICRVNSWVPFLHLLDNLAEYDRDGLRVDALVEVLPIENVSIHCDSGVPVFVYPKSCSRILDSRALLLAVEFFGVEIDLKAFDE